MRALSLILLLALACAGCRSLSFPPDPTAPMDGADAGAIRRQFIQSLPGRYEASGTVVLEYKWRRVTALQMVTVDRTNNSFAVGCVTPVGVTLFQLSGQGEKLEARFLVDDFRQREEFAQAIAADVRAVYLPPVPAADADVRRGRYDVTFVEKSAEGHVEYQFAGRERTLRKTRYYAGNRLVREICYGEYEARGEKLYPRWVMLKNVRYGYTLAVRHTENRGT